MSKKKNTTDKKFMKIKNMLNFKNPKKNFYMDDETFLHWLKNNNSIEEISKYFIKIMDFPKLKNLQINNLIERDITNLHKNIIEHDTKNIWFELSWTALIINKYKVILKDFSSMKLKFESEILLGNFGNASIILDKIEEKFGHSLWLIRNRMIIFQELEGIESQKKYSNSLTEKKDLSPIFQILIYLFSISIEKNVSSIYFEKRIEAFFSESKDLSSTKYIMFKLQKTYYIEPKYYTSILIQEKSSSIIDIYETFLEITTLALLLKLEKDNESNIFIKLLKKLDKSIDDARLINIQRTLGIKKQLTEEEQNRDIIKIYESFLIGNNRDVINLSQNILKKKPIYLSLYKNFLESLYSENIEIPFENNTLIYKILKAYQNMFLINSDTDESIEFLFKTMVTYPHLSLSNHIFSFLYDYIQDNRSSKSQISHFDNSIFSEIKYELYHDSLKIDFLENFRKIYDKSIFIKLLLICEIDNNAFINIINQESISEDNKNSLLMYHYFYHEKYNDSKYFAKKLLLSESIFSKNEAKKIILKALLKEDKYQDGLFEIVDRYLENANSGASLPIIAMVDKIINHIDKTKVNPSEIEASIIFYLSNLLRYHDDSKTRLEFLYEYYLETNNYERPMDLITNYKEKNFRFKKEEVFYLSKICIPDIMKKSIYMDGSIDVEKERIQICHILKNIDEENEKNYLQEIKDREQNLFIQEIGSKIEKNKIYVDIEGIKKICLKELSNDYQRLEVLISAYDYDKDIKIRKLLNHMATISKSKFIIYTPNNVSDNEVYDDFSKIIHHIRDIFVTNKNYGLDVYLSTKIRHGTISNHLRKPLEKENLITLKNKNDIYQENLFWQTNLTQLNNEDIFNMEQSFQKFSFEHDEIIKYLSNTLLQVSTSLKIVDLDGNTINTNQEALFQYHFLHSELEYILYDFIEKKLGYEDFINEMLKVLWSKTDTNLKEVRKVIKETIKKKILDNFDNLQNDLKNIENGISELNNAIARARTDMSVAIDNVISWFGRMLDSDISDYEMIDAITIVQNTFRKEYDFCNIEGSIERYFKGSTLDKFVDIYFIIFDNAFKHSGYQDETKLDVVFSLDKKINSLIILISNNVKSEILLEDLNKKIKSIKDEYGTKKAISSINKEGKTGFNKIWRIITKDLDILEHKLDIEYKKENNFVKFEIKMNVERLLV